MGPNPTDRAKGGVKRSLLTDGGGVPIGLAVDGANRHDMKLARETLESVEAARPSPRRTGKQGLCLDKGYDFPEIRELAREFGYTAHVRSRGEEADDLRRSTRARARRWVVERTHSWLNRFRRVLTRWEKKAANYLGMLHLACSLITWGRAGLLG